jgi:hypothetical protein
VVIDSILAPTVPGTLVDIVTPMPRNRFHRVVGKKTAVLLAEVFTQENRRSDNDSELEVDENEFDCT